MKKIMGKSILLLAGCLLLLCILPITAVAWPPTCPDCYYWDGYDCVPYGDCWGGCPACESCVDCWCQCTSECCDDSDCDECYECSDCECVLKDWADCGQHSDCSDCEYCYDCYCWDWCFEVTECCYCEWWASEECVGYDGWCDEANCYACDNCQCEYQCDPETEVCCNGTCEPKCEEVEQNPCDTSMSWDCFPCQNLYWLCNNDDNVVYTGNHPYNCWSGCPGDCQDMNDVHCYTKYKCTYGDPDYMAWCEWVGPGDFDFECVAHEVGWTCYECIRDPEDEGEKHYVTSKRCQ